MKQLLYIAIAALVSGGIYAQAGIIFDPGNHPQQPGEENVLFTSNQTGPLITGITNQSDLVVNFSSTTDTLNVTANGQAKVTASDGAVNDLTITLANGGTYTDLIINPFLGGSVNSGPAVVTVVASDGTFVYNYPGVGLGNGNNFLTILANPGETIQSTTIDASTGFLDMEQVRISGAAPAAVPEPASLLLLAGGLLAICFRMALKRGMSFPTL